MGKLGLKWLSLAYQERPVHNWYQLGLYFIPVKPGKICILNIAQRQWGGGSCSLFTLLSLHRRTFVTAVTSEHLPVTKYKQIGGLYHLARPRFSLFLGYFIFKIILVFIPIGIFY